MYKLTAYVTVQVEMEFEASSEEDARKIFDEQLRMNATLAVRNEDEYHVDESSIAEIEIDHVHKND